MTALVGSVTVTAAVAGFAMRPVAADAAQTVTVTATDKGYTGMPASLKGGITKFTLKNAGKTPHDLQLVWIDGVRSDAEVAKVVASDSNDNLIPAWLHGGGGIGAVPPGSSASVTVNLRKATYMFFSTSGDGNTDYKAGLHGRFNATSDKAGTEPTAAAKITAKEYGFDVSGLKAGSNPVAFVNVGKQLHLVGMFPINAGKTIADVTKFLSADPNDKNAPPPPVDFTKGSSMEVVDPGVSEVADVTLGAGRYAFVCFLSDRTGGKPHFMSGMIKEVVIK